MSDGRAHRVRALMWDLDGTLIDSHHALVEAALRAVTDMVAAAQAEGASGAIVGMRNVTLSRARAEEISGGGDLYGIFQQIYPRPSGEESSPAVQQWKELRTTFVNRWVHHSDTEPVLQLIRLLPGAREALQAVHARGLPQAIATSRHPGQARRIVEMFGLSEFFLAVEGTGGVPRPLDRHGSPLEPKPAPNVLNHTAGLLRARLNVGEGAQRHPRRSNIVYIGDTDVDVAAARTGGYRSIALRIGGMGREALERSNPEHIVHGPLDAIRALGIEVPEPASSAEAAE